MAIVSLGFEVTASFFETSGKVVTRTYVAGSEITTIGELEAAWALAYAKVQAMSDSVIGVYRVTQIFGDDALALPAAAENSNQAIMTGKLKGFPNKSGEVTIPAVKASLMVSPSGKGYDVLDTSDPVVDAFIKMFDSAIASGDWTISDGESWSYPTVSGKRRNVRSSGT